MEGLELLGLVGSGGFADVHEAAEPALSRHVAVKLFRARIDGNDRRSFEREAGAMGRLSGIHHVVQVYRSGVTEGGHPYLVMELMQGSVADLLVDGPIAVTDTCAAGVLLALALGAAHAEGIMHRDIKPANVLVDRYGEPALSDFGISSLSESDASSSLFAFSAEHSAPEVFDLARSTSAADVYSLASTLFTMMEGGAPFARAPEEGPLAFMRRVQTTPCPPCIAAAAVDPALDELLSAALAKQPEDRPNIDEMVDGLSRFSGTDDRRVGPIPVPRRTGPSAGLAGAGSITSDPPGAATSAPGSGSGSGSESGSGSGSGSDDPAERPRPRSGRVVTLAAAAVIALLVVGGIVGVVASRDGGDEPDPAERTVAEQSVASPDGDSTDGDSTDGVATTEPPRRADGVTNVRRAQMQGLRDDSGMLRDRIDRFASTTSASAVRESTVRNDVTGEDLDFGRLPAELDYAATNLLGNEDCGRIYLDDVIITGAAGSIWSDGRQIVLVNAVELHTELEAQQYYWSTALFLGLGQGDCAGWPRKGPAVNPEDLTVTRRDFPLSTEIPEVLTVIDDTPDLGGIDTGIAYQALSRIGRVVLVISVGSAPDGADPAVATAVLDEALAAFASD